MSKETSGDNPVMSYSIYDFPQLNSLQPTKIRSIVKLHSAVILFLNL